VNRESMNRNLSTRAPENLEPVFDSKLHNPRLTRLRRDPPERARIEIGRRN